MELVVVLMDAIIIIIMSIYSGFATRNQEHFYDQILYNLVSTLLLRVAKFYRREPIDDATFMKIMAEQERSLKKMEKRKVLSAVYSVHGAQIRRTTHQVQKRGGT